jgi:hypothetical protein
MTMARLARALCHSQGLQYTLACTTMSHHNIACSTSCRYVGVQADVVFARDKDAGFRQYAIKCAPACRTADQRSLVLLRPTWLQPLLRPRSLQHDGQRQHLVTLQTQRCDQAAVRSNSATFVCACRFFSERADFDSEVALYRDPVLEQVLPKLLIANGNEGGAMRSRSGFVFPPYIVTERGVTACDWMKACRSYFDIASMIEHLAQLLHTLHASGRVHRDVKPLNVLHLSLSMQWRLIDLGIAASTGALPPAQTAVPMLVPFAADLHSRCAARSLPRSVYAGFADVCPEGCAQRRLNVRPDVYTSVRATRGGARTGREDNNCGSPLTRRVGAGRDGVRGGRGPHSHADNSAVP